MATLRDESPNLPGDGSESSRVAYEENIVYSEQNPRPESSDESIMSKARVSAKALKDLVQTLADKSKATAITKTQEFKEAANDERPEFQKDAADINRLGSLIDNITSSFDNTMDDIGRESYEDQGILFAGYKKLLQEEIHVINARLSMATRLAGAPNQAQSSNTLDPGD